MSARSQEEIADRFHEVAAHPADDILGFRREVLAEAMTKATLIATIPNVGDAPDLADWVPVKTEPAAQNYLDFAIEKIKDHRGISAVQSVDKLREYAWLLGRDDVVETMDAADYPQCGAPKVKAFALGMGWPWPDDADLDRMAAGKPCSPACESGCAW